MLTIEDQDLFFRNITNVWQPQNVQKGWHISINDPVCTWDGITCDEESYVIEIDLNDRGIKATIPNELGNLFHLKKLSLRNNNFSGTLPEYLTNLVNLRELDVSINSITGYLPNFKSDSLFLLIARRNRLKGQIPVNIGYNLPNLDHFILAANSLSGTIPESFSNMNKLDILDVSNNMLEGKIPYLLGDLKELKGLFVHFNQLIGTIPPSLSRSESLIQIYLENNMLSGTIPASLADLPSLKELYVDGNKFTGTVPSDLCSMNLNENFFSKSEAQGRNPERDGCTSIACPVNTVSEEGVFPCSPCNGGYFSPYLGKNSKCYALTQKQVLDNFFDSTNGLYWKSSSGWGMENVHPCAYDGVTCNFAQQVINITLINRGLSGTISDELGFLRHLTYLNLADNDLTGYLPSDLRFAPLEFLDVSGNKLRGEVPPMLCSTGDINGNGRDGVFQCDTIACPIGKYSPSGFALGIEQLAFKVCRSCPSNLYLASRTCNERFSFNTMMDTQNADGSSNALLLVVILVIMALCLSFLFQPTFSKSQQEEVQNDDENEVDGTIGSSKAVANRNQLRPLVFSMTGKLGKVDEHPLAEIQVPNKGSVGPGSVPSSWGNERVKDTEDEWLPYT